MDEYNQRGLLRLSKQKMTKAQMNREQEYKEKNEMRQVRKREFSVNPEYALKYRVLICA